MTKKFELDWTIDYDDNDNDIWEAISPYAWEEDGPMVFRIKQRLVNNKIEFYEASDAELIYDDVSREWDSLEQAKADMQQDADDIVEEFSKQEQEETQTTIN